MGGASLKHALLLAALLAAAVGHILPEDEENQLEPSNDVTRTEPTNENQLYTFESYEDSLSYGDETEVAVEALETLDDKLDTMVDKVWKAESSSSESLTARLEGVALQAERIQDAIDTAVDDELEETGDVEADMDVIKAEAQMMADDVNALVNDARRETVSTNSDVTFDRDMTSLKTEAEDVVRMARDAEEKAKLAERKKKGKGKKRKGKGRKRKNKKDRRRRKDKTSKLESTTYNANVTRPAQTQWLPQPSSLMSDSPYYDYNRGSYYGQGSRYRETSEPELVVAVENERYDRRSSRSDTSPYLTYRSVEDYFRQCDNCMVRTNDYDCPLHEDALNMKKWVTELQELISYGCQKPEACHEDGTCCLADRQIFRDLMGQITSLVTDFRQLIETECRECSVDCGWSEWSSWSSCDVTCGTGQRTRSRRKDNPPRKASGRDCVGPEREVDTCSQVPCPTDGNWSPWDPWEPCSVTCGNGVQSRMRRCDNPAPSYGGRRCEGDSRETRTCYSGVRCTTDGNWSPWDPWTPCSVTCGNGVQTRMRRCDNPAPSRGGRRCEGDSRESRECYAGTPCCVDGNWGSWSSWDRCPVSCGQGTTSRRRYCDNPTPNFCGNTCPGRGFETKDCNSQPCPITCPEEYETWSQWSGCTTSCGMGRVSRQRRCRSPIGCPACRLPPQTEVKDMRCGPEQLDGNWGSWTSWDGCSVTCGGGMTSRQRYCDNPRPNQCGRSCPGLGYQSKDCNEQPCRDCRNQYSPWTPWSQCTSDCGIETVTRQRNCYRDPGCGPCRNSVDTEVRQERCGPPRGDAEWSRWGPWSPCPVTCGGGLQSRTRRCDPTPCETPCRGESMETRTCGQADCPIERRCEKNWSNWGSWSSCSATCGSGSRSRTRRCVIVSSGIGCDFVDCPGSALDTQECSLPGCCVWGSWSACSATCAGYGSQMRQEMCSDGRGGSTIGRVERRTCIGDGPACAPPERYSWDSWQNWCDCNCASGMATRNRNCLNLGSGTREVVDIAFCSGEARQNRTCDVRDIRNCPQCIMSCAGRSDGKHPSCTSCEDYIECRDGSAKLFKCREGTEWDGFMKKCMPGPSTTCTLKLAVRSCAGLMDAKYHSVQGCGFFIQCLSGRASTEEKCMPGFEFNYYAQACERLRSPSCIRIDLGNMELNEAVIEGIITPVNDAPISDYFNEAVDISEEEAKKKYVEELKKEEKLKKKKKKLTWKELMATGDAGAKTDAPTTFSNPGCVDNCKGVTSGKYASCNGCDSYVICTIHERLRERRCKTGRQYDAISKRCMRKSRTCRPKQA